MISGLNWILATAYLRWVVEKPSWNWIWGWGWAWHWWVKWPVSWTDLCLSQSVGLPELVMTIHLNSHGFDNIEYSDGDSTSRLILFLPEKLLDHLTHIYICRLAFLVVISDVPIFTPIFTSFLLSSYSHLYFSRSNFFFWTIQMVCQLVTIFHLVLSLDSCAANESK